MPLLHGAVTVDEETTRSLASPRSWGRMTKPPPAEAGGDLLALWPGQRAEARRVGQIRASPDPAGSGHLGRREKDPACRSRRGPSPGRPSRAEVGASAKVVGLRNISIWHIRVIRVCAVAGQNGGPSRWW